MSILLLRISPKKRRHVSLQRLGEECIFNREKNLINKIERIPRIQHHSVTKHLNCVKNTWKNLRKHCLNQKADTSCHVLDNSIHILFKNRQTSPRVSGSTFFFKTVNRCSMNFFLHRHYHILLHCFSFWYAQSKHTAYFSLLSLSHNY